MENESEKRNAVRHGIISDDSCTLNCMRLRINTKDKEATIAQDDAIAKAYGNKFIIPLEFEMLDSSIPYYQSGLGNQVCNGITFSNYGKLLVHQTKMLSMRSKISP